MSGWIAPIRRNPVLSMFLRFVAIGGINTLLSLLVYWLALLWIPPQAAYAVSFAAGMVLGYLLHTRYAFRARRAWRSFVVWPLVCLAGWAVGAGMLQLAIGPLAIDPRLAPLLSIAVSLPVTFLLGRRLLAPSRNIA